MSASHSASHKMRISIGPSVFVSTSSDGTRPGASKLDPRQGRNGTRGIPTSSSATVPSVSGTKFSLSPWSSQPSSMNYWTTRPLIPSGTVASGYAAMTRGGTEQRRVCHGRATLFMIHILQRS
jgi:hypothetical protein